MCRSLWVTGQFLKVWAHGTCFWKETLLSILRNPRFWSPCMVFFQRPLHLPLSALPPVLPQVAELQERAVAQSQEQAILQRSLEDKAAELEVERVGAKVSVRRAEAGAGLGNPAGWVCGRAGEGPCSSWHPSRPCTWS